MISKASLDEVFSESPVVWCKCARSFEYDLNPNQTSCHDELDIRCERSSREEQKVSLGVDVLVRGSSSRHSSHRKFPNWIAPSSGAAMRPQGKVLDATFQCDDSERCRDSRRPGATSTVPELEQECTNSERESTAGSRRTFLRMGCGDGTCS